MRVAGVGILCFILGVLLALMLRPEPPPKEAPPPACPPPVACPACPGGPSGPPKPARASATAKRPPRPARPAPLPELASDPEAHRERLRSWFESNAERLLDCVDKGEPHRRLLLEMKIEPDGAIADASLLGADDLPAASAACVKKKVTALKVPREELRGRETLVVHVNL